MLLLEGPPWQGEGDYLVFRVFLDGIPVIVRGHDDSLKKRGKAQIARAGIARLDACRLLRGT